MYRDIFQWIESTLKSNYDIKGLLTYKPGNKIISISSKNSFLQQLDKPCSIHGYYFKDLIHYINFICLTI